MRNDPTAVRQFLRVIAESKSHSDNATAIASRIIAAGDRRHSYEALARDLRMRRRAAKRGVAYLVDAGFFSLVDESAAGVLLRPNLDLGKIGVA